MSVLSLVHIHGLANGPQDRARIRVNIHKKWADSAAGKAYKFFRVAEWRSRGSWSMDLADLGHPDGIRAHEAVDDVCDAIRQEVDDDGDGGSYVLSGHSMGQVFARLAAIRYPPRVLITEGGPLGNPVLRGGLYLQPWARRCEEPYPGKWVDVWNREDPICSDILMGYQKPVGVTQSVQVEAPGHPSIADPLAEHGAYFDLPAFWQIVADAAKEGT
jgi:pimeloyl-ACP methyl ester carboxylesterase